MTYSSRHCGPPPTQAEIEDAFRWTTDGWHVVYLGNAAKVERLQNAVRVLSWVIRAMRLLPAERLASMAEAGVLPSAPPTGLGDAERGELESYRAAHRRLTDLADDVTDRTHPITEPDELLTVVDGAFAALRRDLDAARAELSQLRQLYEQSAAIHQRTLAELDAARVEVVRLNGACAQAERDTARALLVPSVSTLQEIADEAQPVQEQAMDAKPLSDGELREIGEYFSGFTRGGHYMGPLAARLHREHRERGKRIAELETERGLASGIAMADYTMVGLKLNFTTDELEQRIIAEVKHAINQRCRDLDEIPARSLGEFVKLSFEFAADNPLPGDASPQWRLRSRVELATTGFEYVKPEQKEG